jgi:hypothetical protein
MPSPRWPSAPSPSTCPPPPRPASCPTTPRCRPRCWTGRGHRLSLLARQPAGRGRDRAYWRDLLALAEKHDFRIFADECYSEIWRDEPTARHPEAARVGADPERVSGLPLAVEALEPARPALGLRRRRPQSIAADPAAARLRRRAAALPLQRRGRRLGGRGACRREPRALPRSTRIADEIFGNLPGYRRRRPGSSSGCRSRMARPRR